MSILNEDLSRVHVPQRAWVSFPSHDTLLFNHFLDDFLLRQIQKLDIISYTVSHKHHHKLRNLVHRCIVGLNESAEEIDPTRWPNTTFRQTDGVHIKLYLLRNPRRSTRTHTHAIIGSHNFVLNTSYNLSYVITNRPHVSVLSRFFSDLWRSLA